MQNHDEEQFETYLKRFHPIAPEPLPTVRVGARRRPSYAPGVWLAAIAAILVVGIMVSHTRDEASIDRSVPLEPLTIRSANAWLAAAPSFKTAVDDLAFRSPRNPIASGKQSAIAVLSEKGINL